MSTTANYGDDGLGWRRKAGEALRLEQWPELPGMQIVAAIDDYLERHADLEGELADVADETHDDLTCADRARQLLHEHLLVITLLLQRIDAHEWHRRLRMHDTARPETPDSPA